MKLIGKLVGGVFKLIALPFRLLFKTVALFTRLTAKVAFLPVRAGRATTRMLGLKGLLFGLLGLAIGLLFAPVPGRELREKLLAMLSGSGSVPDDELADKVSFELSHAPRTWHLEPQPEVSVLAGRVVLSGEVRGGDARDEFARVAAAVPGVIAVDNQLEVAVAGAEGGSE
ncbi:MAG: BON domain-containing protein [Actinobacteria bacterium]|nr:BON domain-containing protein [Actinomycetota bacterium]